MKRRNKIRSLRLSGATLAEVLVALALTSIVFIIGTMIWMNLNTQDAPRHIQRTRLVAREMIGEVERNGDMGEETVMKGGIRYLREVRPLNDHSGLVRVTVTCLDADGGTILTRSKIVRAHGRE
jgi:hypothetical protein